MPGGSWHLCGRRVVHQRTRSENPEAQKTLVVVVMMVMVLMMIMMVEMIGMAMKIKKF